MKTGLIIEDHQSAQQWLRDALAAAFPGIAISLASSLAEANARLDAAFPEIALVDLNLPDGNGVDLIARINTESPNTATIVTTIYDDDDHLFPALRAGANGYILKEQRKEEICRLLQGIVSGEPPLSPGISQRMLNYFASIDSPPEMEQEQVHILTQRERKVLSVIAQGHSLKEASKLLGVSHNTVATQVKSIYSKLNISSRAEAALAASKMGIIG
jgi:DNA-binding NarL/FixJ family response regulator